MAAMCASTWPLERPLSKSATAFSSVLDGAKYAAAVSLLPPLHTYHFHFLDSRQMAGDTGEENRSESFVHSSGKAGLWWLHV